MSTPVLDKLGRPITAARTRPLRPMFPVIVRIYDCVHCQQSHMEGDPLYADHLGCQSKHGVRRAVKPDAWSVEFMGYAD